MKKLYLLPLVMMLSGCALLETKEPAFKESNRNKQLKACLYEMLDRGLSPKSAITVCERIYKIVE